VRDIHDAFWRAAFSCLHPRVILWSLVPLVVAGAIVGLVGWAFWESAIDGVRQALEAWSLGSAALQWLNSIGAPQLRAMVAPLVVVALSVPVVLLLTLLLVATLATPAVVRLVVARRFPDLAARQGANALQGLAWAMACTLAAVIALVLSIPLWLVPPLVMVLPPLIWGWLTCRVFSFDVLAHHASAAERRAVMHGRRWSLLVMGVICGFLGTAPSLLFAFSVSALLLAPVLALVAVWLYTIVFVFSACWFAHFCLAELARLRGLETPAATVQPPLEITNP
jgi:hypothetical protein